MNFSQADTHKKRHIAAIGGVVVLHLIIGYVLMNGLAYKLVKRTSAPVDVSIIEEVKEVHNLPPPSTPAKSLPPPPAYAPPTPTAVAVSNAITAVSSAPPKEAAQPVNYAPTPVAVGAVCPNHLAVRSNVPYPPLAQRQGLSGEVVVEFTVNTDGRPGNAAIVKSSNPVFNATALAAVGKFQCKGQAQPVRARVPFAFKLEN